MPAAVPELVRAMRSLGIAARAPAGTDPAWADRVVNRVQLVRTAFVAHVESSEGVDGGYADAARSDGRLTFRAHQLAREHAALDSRLTGLVDLARSPDVRPVAIRRPVEAALAELRRHRERGADLVFEAFQFDLGGSG